MKSAFERLKGRARREERVFLERALALLRKMRLAPPSQHYLADIGSMRFIQHDRETGERQNPDNLVGRLLTAPDRRLARLADIETLRARPFYHFLLARTRFYDQALRTAIEEGFRQIFFFGVGSDTRSFRFQREIDAAGVRVIETDLEPWISQRARLSRRLKAPSDLHHAAFDLESEGGGSAAARLLDRGRRTLFIAEGLSPYLKPFAISRLFEAVREFGAKDGRLSYDAKLAGADENPARLFRMPREREEILRLHRRHGLDVREMLFSAGLQQSLAPYPAPLFEEDVVLVVTPR